MKTILFDIDNDGWVFSERKNKTIGKTLEHFNNYLYNVQRNQSIIVNRSLNNIVKLFNEYNLTNNQDYKININWKQEIVSVVYEYNGNKIVFKPFSLFFGHSFNIDIDTNIERMWNDVKDFEQASKIKDWQTKRSMEALVRNYIKSKINWEKNYSEKITEQEFHYLKNWVHGAFRFMNEEYKEKVINTIEYDINSSYQNVWENYPMPVGKPIRHKQKSCEHELKLIACALKGKVKKDCLPILRKKQINFDFKMLEEEIKVLNDETIYVTEQQFWMIFDFYDIDNVQIKDIICFETYKGNGWKEINELFHNIRLNIKNKDLKKIIKISENKFIGSQISDKFLNIKTFEVSNVDINSNISGIKNGREIKIVPYAPLYLFITDFARNNMSNIVQGLMKHVVVSNCDNVFLVDTVTQEEIDKYLKIDDTKIGYFKKACDWELSWFKTPTHYLKASSFDKYGGVTKFCWSGLKDKQITSLSLEKAIERLGKNE